jgi:hypothetical protein
MTAESEPRNWKQCLKEGDLQGFLLRILLFVTYVSTWFSLFIAVVFFAFAIWAVFVADPNVMAPGSLNRDSPTSEKLGGIMIMVLFVVFTVLWLFSIRWLRHWSSRPRS